MRPGGHEGLASGYGVFDVPAHHWNRHGAAAELRAPVRVTRHIQMSHVGPSADVPRRSYRRGES